MLNYILRRSIIAFFMLIGVGMVSFIVIKLPPGDFATRYESYLLAQGMPQTDAERLAQDVRVQYGLDKPAVEQFLCGYRACSPRVNSVIPSPIAKTSAN